MRRARTAIVAGALALGYAGGLARGFLAPGQDLSAVDIPFVLAGTMLTFLWFRIDTDRTGYRRSPLLNVAVIAISILALPYYFLRSRGIRHGIAASGLFLAVAVAYSLLQFAGECSVYSLLRPQAG